MKQLLMILGLISFVGMVHADELDKVQSEEIPKCLMVHQVAAMNALAGRPDADTRAYTQSTLGDDHFKRLDNLAKQYFNDQNIMASYRAMSGPDISGRTLAPAIVLSLCISTIQG